MFCSQCGFCLADDTRFCPNCGTAINTQPNRTTSNIKSVQLRCQDCGGIMNVEEDRVVLSCPYCGSKKLLIENDRVKIAKIKSQTRKDIEMGKQQAYRDVEIGKQMVEEKKSKRDTIELIAMLIVIVFLFSLMAGLGVAGFLD